MADAPGHLLGQIVGNALESSVRPLLQAIADEHGLYLDSKGRRPARPGSKVTWEDGLGNRHDLDFVLERGGTSDKIGQPAAFIETAWRRYTKHSRAKAQEIQGALLPLLAAHSDVKPFAGAVVAGEWTSGALEQMRSSGFAVLHVRYADIVETFAKFGIDLDTGEDTPDEYLRAQAEKYRLLTSSDRDAIGLALCSESSDEYQAFRIALEGSLTRRIVHIVIIPLYGGRLNFASVEEAARAIRDYDTSGQAVGEFIRFEIQMKYSNDDMINATFRRADDAAAFLDTFA